MQEIIFRVSVLADDSAEPDELATSMLAALHEFADVTEAELEVERVVPISSYPVFT